MHIQQLYTNCLAEAAYYIESNGEAAIIDPLRETHPYLQLAKKRGTSIKYVFETHFHADFVSGHLDLAKATGAEIVYGPTASALFDITTAADNQMFSLGNVKIKVLHTPGHTMESSCFLLIDETGQERAIFTGDTLFIGDVGRPDLAAKSDLSVEDLAKYLYRSLQDKIMTLDDAIIVYPGHGAGSQCGKKLSTKTQSTIGEQRLTNYALQAESQDAFVKSVTEGLSAPPQYFPKNVEINKSGYTNIDVVLSLANTKLSVDAFEQEIENGALIIDSRSTSAFSKGFVAGSINIGLEGFFAVWVGTLIEDLETPILLITETGEEEDTILRLARVGFENVKGYLDGGFDTWNKQHPELITSIKSICPIDYKNINKIVNTIDIRTKSEYLDGHETGSTNLPLAEIEQHISELNPAETYYIYCKSGYRSVIACSILLRHGFTKIVNIKKGYEALSNPAATCCCSKINTI